MIKKHIGFVILLLSIPTQLLGQARPSTQSDSVVITMQDLQPAIQYSSETPFYQPLRTKPGLALVSSAIIPGSGQAANDKWVRAGAYFVAELVLVGLHIKNFYDAKAEERRYKKFANNNWSVVTYAKWLVEYHNQNQQIDNPHIDDLANKVSGVSASYDPQKDWGKVDLELLRKVERNTPFVYPDQKAGNNFSHIMPDYGSQQYYELISKYYQYGPGWNDFTTQYQLPWNGNGMPDNFFRGATLAEDFNDSYRLAGNMVSLLILNHIVSAFDAYLTVKLKNNRLKAETNLLQPHQAFSLKYHF